MVSVELEDTVLGNLLTSNTEAGPTVANPLSGRLDQTRQLLLCTETLLAPLTPPTARAARQAPRPSTSYRAAVAYVVPCPNVLGNMLLFTLRAGD